MEIPSLKNIEDSSSRLCIAFFAIASVLQPWAIVPFPHGLIDSAEPQARILLSAGTWGVVWALISITAIWLTLIVGVVIAYIPVIGELLRDAALPTIGVAFFSMGALALCKIPPLQTSLAIKDPLPSINVFWEFGLLTYGLCCLRTWEKLTNSIVVLVNPEVTDRLRIVLLLSIPACAYNFSAVRDSFRLIPEPNGATNGDPRPPPPTRRSATIGEAPEADNC